MDVTLTQEKEEQRIVLGPAGMCDSNDMDSEGMGGGRWGHGKKLQSFLSSA